MQIVKYQLHLPESAEHFSGLNGVRPKKRRRV